MFGLRSDHDAEEYSECRLCSPFPGRAEYGQRGCPTTGLPVAPVWRSRAVSEVAVDPMVRERVGVAVAHQRAATQFAERGRVRQVARWHAEDQVGAPHREAVADWGGPGLTGGGAV